MSCNIGIIKVIFIKNKQIGVFAGLLVGVIFSGCTTTPPPDRMQIRPVVLNLPLDQAMQVAESVLGEMHFTLRRIDTENRRILTYPLPGAQFFEFWRKDAIGSFNRIESTLHTVRRTAELTFLPVNNATQIVCVVRTERLNLPSRETASPNQAYQILTESSPIVQTLKLSADQIRGMSWVPLGQDSELANLILQNITQHQEDQDWTITVAASTQNDKRNRNQ